MSGAPQTTRAGRVIGLLALLVALWVLVPGALVAWLAGSRVKQTPVPESAPRLPNTIVHTFTAVPRSCGIRSRRR